jgi:hypothetical protein
MGEGDEAGLSRPDSAFAHASEAEFARILDFYQVTWEYEPQVFPILWDLDGNVLESFAPDFYLPELEIFVELTTLQQRLVRKKNRKVRRLRELYPGLRIKLLYARDFRALMLKYGRTGLLADLTGTLGQLGPHGEDDGPSSFDSDAPAVAGSGHAPDGEAERNGVSGASSNRSPDAPHSRSSRRDRRRRHKPLAGTDRQPTVTETQR